MITGYIIEKCEDGTDKWLRCNARLCPDLYYRVCHLDKFCILNLTILIYYLMKRLFCFIMGSLMYPMSYIKVSGLKFGQKYHYRVCAENAAGVSDPADALGPLFADDPHGKLF